MGAGAALLVLMLCAGNVQAQRVSGFLQADFAAGQESEDQLDNGTGEPLNQNRFFLRRARLRVHDELPYLGYAAELESLTVAAPTVGLRHVEVNAHWPRREGDAPPPAPWEDPTQSSGDLVVLAADGGVPEPGLRLRAGAGIFRAPFGHDVYEQSPTGRLFAESSLLAAAFFPGDFDVGARASAAYRNVQLTVGVQNGEPMGSRVFPGRDPNADKDFFVRVTAHGAPAERVRLEGGVSAMTGRGFHPGAGPTKDVLIWRDLNEDALVQLAELQAIRGSAGIISENFDRWAVGADGRARVTVPWGALWLFAEGALASNLDRGIRPADPIFTGQDQRAIAGYVAAVQELWQWALVGFRVDYYQPQLDAAELQNGILLRSLERFTSYSFAAAVRVGDGRVRGRLSADYTLRQDPLGRNSAGQVQDLANDVFTLRAQVEF